LYALVLLFVEHSSTVVTAGFFGIPLFEVSSSLFAPPLIFAYALVLVSTLARLICLACYHAGLMDQNELLELKYSALFMPNKKNFMWKIIYFARVAGSILLFLFLFGSDITRASYGAAFVIYAALYRAMHMSNAIGNRIFFV